MPRRSDAYAAQRRMNAQVEVFDVLLRYLNSEFADLYGHRHQYSG
jgi:hypothetical protein